MNASFSSLEPSDSPSPTVSDLEGLQALRFVRQKPEVLSSMSHMELLLYALRCSQAAREARDRYERDGFFADAGERDYWIHAEAEALVIHGQARG